MTAALIIFQSVGSEVCVLKPDSGDPRTIA
jgi:hypothetical protein